MWTLVQSGRRPSDHQEIPSFITIGCNFNLLNLFCSSLLKSLLAALLALYNLGKTRMSSVCLLKYFSLGIPNASVFQICIKFFSRILLILNSFQKVDYSNGNVWRFCWTDSSKCEEDRINGPKVHCCVTDGCNAATCCHINTALTVLGSLLMLIKVL